MRTTILISLFLFGTIGFGQENFTVKDIHPAVFDQNIGQFEDSVLFHAKLGQVHYYFTESGYTASYYVRYSREEEHERREKEERGEPVSEREQRFWSVKFENSSTEVEVNSFEKQTYTFNYPKDKNTFVAPAFKKIVYSNIYPNIDIEFLLSGQDSLKYNVVVHPGGDLKKVKISVPGSAQITKTVNNNLSLGNGDFEFQESIPYSYQDEDSKSVMVNYNIEKNIISFEAEKYDKTKTLVVDPWNVLVSPFSTGTDFFKIDYNDVGDVWVLGELGNELARYNGAGALQWVYIFGFFGSTHGDFSVRQSTSEVYACPSGTQLVRVSPTGTLISNVDGATATTYEVWRIDFDEVNDKVVIGMGGAYVDYLYYLATAPPDLSSINLVNILPYVHDYTSDISMIEIDPDGSKVYSIAATSVAWFSPGEMLYANHVVVCDLPGLTSPYNFPTHHNFIEIGNGGYADYPTGAYNGPNTYQGIAVGDVYLYTYDGHSLKKFNKTSGVLQDSVLNADPVMSCSGIALDDCGNVYIGTTDSVVTFSENLNYLGGFNIGHVVIDVRISGLELWACGEDFLSEYNITSTSSELVLVSTPPSGCGVCDGSVTATTVSCPGYVLDEITWLPGGATTLTVNGLCNDWYVATAVFINALLMDTITVVDSVEVTNGSSSINVTQNSTDETCDGDDDGTITLNATTGTAPFTYDIGSASNTTGNFANLSPGVYNITVTDDVGCESTSTITIDPGVIINVTFTIQDEDCGLNNGSVIAVASNGTAPYDYDLGAFSNTTGSFTNMGAGSYPFTVTDDNGCTFTSTVIVPGSSDLNLSIVTQNDPTCFGFSDGSITLDITGGTAPITITWSPVNPVPGGVFNNLPAGTYTATASDVNGCPESITVILNEPPAIDADLIITNPNCFGAANGVVVVDTVYNAQGAQNGISYFWNPNPAGVGGLGADSSYQMPIGDYILIINDAFGCSQQIPFTLTQPDAIVFTQIGYTPAYCRTFSYQSGQGVVFAAASGGTPDYTYLWQNLGTGQTSNNSTWGGLNPGSYQITVTDDVGCELTQVLQVDSLNPIADFTIASNQLNSSLEGTAVVCVEFTNQSLYFVNASDPNADTVFWWNLNTPSAPWSLSTDYFETFDTCYTTGGTYEVCLVAVNFNDCLDTMCQIITVFNPLEFTPVNIFSPEGDGANDEFTFKHLASGVKTFHCVIVNRWGVTVAEINSISDGWDGKDKGGKLCTNGVYFYVYSGEGENGEPFEGQGTIQIVGIPE